MFDGVRPGDRVGIRIQHPGLDRPVNVPIRRRDKLDAEVVLKEIEDVQQSQTNFHLDDQMVWEVTKLGIPSGSGRVKRNKTSNFEEWFSGKSGHGSCVIKIINTDNRCLARSLVTGLCHLHKDDSDEG